MSLITLDFETFYDKGYSLSKMTTQEYILDPRFQVIGVSIAVDNAEPAWYTGAAVKPALDAIDWKLSTLLAQNTKFDGAILAWKYGHIPGFLVDTMSMAVTTGLSRAAHGASLAALTKHLIEHGYPVPPKGDEVVKALGKRLEDFRPEQLDAYGEYCKDDVRITRYIFNLLADMLPDAELMWHDFVMRMYIEPRFVLDAPTIDNELVRVHARRAEVATEVMAKLGIDSNVEFMKSIMSNPKFAAAIESYGGEPPLKISKTTGKETFAFARTDEGMLALLEDDNEYVRALAEARLGLKSSIEVTRCERFRDLAKLGSFPIPYHVSGTATHRLSGCLTADTDVICMDTAGNVATKKIVDVTIDDLVWDGVEFVQHEGVKFSGYKEVISYDGIRGTPDHEVFITADTSLSLAEAKARRARIMDCPAPSNWELNTDR